MGSYLTIGYLQSKTIRTPLHMNREWNAKVNACKDSVDLMVLVCNEATVSEKDYLISAILTLNEANASGKIPTSDEQIPERY